MCQCKVIEYVIGNIFRVWHFADGPLGLVSQTPAHLDQCILYRAEESLFWGNLACSSFSTSLEKKRGVICVLKTICSRGIDPEKSNLSISCQLYRTLSALDFLCPYARLVTVVPPDSRRSLWISAAAGYCRLAATLPRWLGWSWTVFRAVQADYLLAVYAVRLIFWDWVFSVFIFNKLLSYSPAVVSRSRFWQVGKSANASAGTFQ